METEGSLPHSQSSPPVSILSQINPIHDPSHFLKIHITFIFPSSLSLPSGPFLSGFPTIIPQASLLALIRATCTAHFIFLDLIPPPTFGEE